MGAAKPNRRGEQLAAQRAEILRLTGQVKSENTSLALVFQAIQRQTSVLAVLDYRHGRQGRSTPEIAAAFSLALYATLYCETLGDKTLTRAGRTRLCLSEVKRLLPGCSDEQIAHLATLEKADLLLDNAEVGKLIAFTWAEYAAIRQAPSWTSREGAKLQLQPFDLTTKAFKAKRDALNRDIAAQRKAKSRLKAGLRTKAQERAENEEWAAYLAGLASEHGKSERTIRNWLASGKIAGSRKFQNRVRENKKEVIADTALQKSDERRDGRPRRAAVAPRCSEPAPDLAGAVIHLLDAFNAPVATLRARICRLTSPTATALSRLRQIRKGGAATGRSASIPTTAQLSATTRKG